MKFGKSGMKRRCGAEDGDSGRHESVENLDFICCMEKQIKESMEAFNQKGSRSVFEESI